MARRTVPHSVSVVQGGGQTFLWAPGLLELLAYTAYLIPVGTHIFCYSVFAQARQSLRPLLAKIIISKSTLTVTL